MNLENKNILITVSGADHPGITAGLMNCLAENGDELLDLGQAVTHGLLSLSIVIKTRGEEGLKELVFKAKEMGVHVEYEVIEDLPGNDYDHEKFILNCVSVDPINAKFMHQLAQLMAESNVNIYRIDKVSPKSFNSLEITTTIPEQIDLQALKKELLRISTDFKVDVAFLKDNVFRRSKRLIVFDMDSTLIQTEVIDEMAQAAGVGHQVKEITEHAMNGEINFDQSLKQRVGLLKGLETHHLQSILDQLPFTPGAEEFIKTIKSLGYKVGIISGGFSFFANALKEKLGLDYAFANELKVVDSKLTGELDGAIVNAEQKAIILKLIAQQESINLEQVVAIGDGANDLPMLSTAGLGIAFHAKDIVRKQAEQHMSHGPMTSILYFLGIPGPQ